MRKDKRRLPNTTKEVNVYKFGTSEFVGNYYSVHAACRALNLTQSNASACLNGKLNHHRGYVLKLVSK